MLIDWKHRGEVRIGFAERGEVVVVTRSGISSSYTALLAHPTAIRSGASHD